MRSYIAWIGLSLSSLLGATPFTGCNSHTDSEVGSAYPITGKQCDTPGETAEAADGCNECTCGSDGKWTCTDVACPPQGDAGAPPPHEDCIRSDTGGWVCTELPLPTGCTEGDTRQQRCNTCTCHAGGSWSCTDMACPSQCTPGDSEWSADGCDGCDCNADGFWECQVGACNRPSPICIEGTRQDLGCMSCECRPASSPDSDGVELWCDYNACYDFN